MRAIADTHALIWYLLNDPRLLALARSVFVDAVANGEKIGIPSICIVEIVYLTEKGHIPGAALVALQQQLQSMQSVLSLVPLSEDVAFQVKNIDRSAIPDMPDRIIAATAIQYQLPLLSRDGKIRASTVTTIW